MKYIFRCALLTNFTDNREQIGLKDLRETLASLNYKCPNLEATLQQWSNCIEQLILATASPQKPDALSALIKQYSPQDLAESEVNEVQAVWDSEA